MEGIALISLSDNPPDRPLSERMSEEDASLGHCELTASRRRGREDGGGNKTKIPKNQKTNKCT